MYVSSVEWSHSWETDSLSIAQLSAFFGNRMFITMSTGTFHTHSIYRQWGESSGHPHAVFEIRCYHIIYPRNSELVFALNLFKLQFLYLFISTIRASFLVYIILIDFTIFCEEYQVWSLLLYNLLHLFLFLELFPFQIISLSLFVRMICILNSAF